MGPGEQRVHEASFHHSILTPWLKVRLNLTSDRVIAASPRIAFGCIKIGTEHASHSLALVTSVNASTAVSVVRLGVGGFVALFGAVNIVRPGEAGVMAVLMVIGLLLVGSSFRAAITIVERDGTDVAYDISWLERTKATAFAAEVGRVTSQGPWIGLRDRVPPHLTSETHPTLHPAEITPASALVNPIETLAQLADMRARGLITPAEYDAKKTELLSRL